MKKVISVVLAFLMFVSALVVLASAVQSETGDYYDELLQSRIIEVGIENDWLEDFGISVSDTRMCMKFVEEADGIQITKFALVFRIGFVNVRIVFGNEGTDLYIGEFIKIGIEEEIVLTEAFMPLTDNWLVYDVEAPTSGNFDGYRNVTVRKIKVDLVESAVKAEKNGILVLPDGVTLEGKTEEEIIEIIKAGGEENEEILEFITAEYNIYYSDNMILDIIMISNGKIVSSFNESGIRYIKAGADESIFEAPKFCLDLSIFAKFLYYFFIL